MHIIDNLKLIENEFMCQCSLTIKTKKIKHKEIVKIH